MIKFRHWLSLFLLIASTSLFSTTTPIKNKFSISAASIVDLQMPFFFSLIGYELKFAVPISEDFSLVIPVRNYYQNVPTFFEVLQRSSNYWDISSGLGVRWFFYREQFKSLEFEMFSDLLLKSGYNLWHRHISDNLDKGDVWIGTNWIVALQMIIGSGWTMGLQTGFNAGGYVTKISAVRMKTFLGLEHAIFVGYSW
jgi:predicted glycosyltransferase involved in capsule biosynthesis